MAVIAELDITSRFNPELPQADQTPPFKVNQTMIDQIRAGNMEPFGDIYLHYQREVFAHAYGMTRSIEHAEDFTSQTFEKALKGILDDKYKVTGAPFIYWLKRIEKNLILSSIKSAKREITDPFDIPVEDGRDFETERMTSLEVGEVSEGLKFLNENQRRVIVYIANGYSYDEIANLMQIEVNFVRTIKHRAKARLQEFLDGKSMGKNGQQAQLPRFQLPFAGAELLSSFSGTKSEQRKLYVAARSGRLSAVKAGDKWFTTGEAVADFLHYGPLRERLFNGGLPAIIKAWVETNISREGERQVVNLSLDGLTNGEITDTTGHPEGSIKVLLSRGREYIEEKLLSPAGIVRVSLYGNKQVYKAFKNGLLPATKIMNLYYTTEEAVKECLATYPKRTTNSPLGKDLE